MPRGRGNPFRIPRKAPPKPPPAIKMNKPKTDFNGLTAAYEWMPVDRAISFHLAFEWYGANAATMLFGDPLTPEAQKSYDRGVKAKNLGDSTEIVEEKQHAWITALHLYEKTWNKHPLPKIDTALAATAVALRVANIQRVIASLNTAFGDLAVKFGVTVHNDREITSLPGMPKMICVPERELNLLVGAPPLKTILDEALTVAKVISIVTTKEGAQELDGELFMQNLPTVMHHVTTWAISTDEKVTKPVGKVTNAPAVPRAARAPRAPGTSTKLRPSFNLDDVITVITRVGLKGSRGKVLEATTDGMSVRDYVIAAQAVGHNKGAAFHILSIMVDKGIASVAPKT